MVSAALIQDLARHRTTLGNEDLTPEQIEDLAQSREADAKTKALREKKDWTLFYVCDNWECGKAVKVKDIMKCAKVRR